MSSDDHVWPEIEVVESWPNCHMDVFDKLAGTTVRGTVYNHSVENHFGGRLYFASKTL